MYNVLISTEKEVVQQKSYFTATQIYPAETDVFKTSSGCLKKVTTSYDQTRRRRDVWKKTSDLGRLEDVLKTSYLRRPEDVQFTIS